MSGGTGSLNQAGCPTISIEVTGAIPGSSKSIVALVDTGFTGFLSLPILEAFPIGLILHGTTSVILADGTRHSKFTCLGVVSYGGENKAGVVIIEPSSDEAIVGMDFLKKFRLTLLTDPDSGTVALFDSDLIKQALAAAAAKKNP